MRHWVFDPISVACLVVSGALYSAGIARLRARAGHAFGIRPWQIGAFAAGWIALVIALLSPVAAISDVLFSMHMTQHEILILVAAPLLVIGRPLVPFLWAFSPRWRIRLGGWSRGRYWSAAWKTLTGPLLVWLLHGLALWVWHLPALYQAALRNSAIHAVEHLCFLVTACLFWWALIHGRYGRVGYGAAVVFVFATAVHSGALGALLTFAPRVWYPLYAARASLAGADPLEDQQLAGLIMWIPFGVIFLILGLGLFAAWLGEAERKSKPASWIPLVLLPLVLTLANAGCESSDHQYAEEITGGHAAAGKLAIERYGCGSCHRIPGISGADALVGPSLERIASRTYIAGHLINEPKAMVPWIRDARHLRSPTAMPTLGVTEQEARDIAAYLYTLK
jgi:cytochrome c oxidase assembly factor CtaG